MSTTYVISTGSKFPQSQKAGGRWNVLHTTRVYVPEGPTIMALLRPWPTDPSEARKFPDKKAAEAVRQSFGFPEKYLIEVFDPSP